MPDEGTGLRVEFDPAQFAAFMASLKAFEPTLATATRRNLRRTGDPLIEDMRATVGGGGPVRAGISAGLRTQVATGKRMQGVRISASAAQIPEGHKPMLRLWNKASWRHPLWGNPHVWFEQGGRPYFGSVIRRHESAIVDAIREALGEALDAMGDRA